MRGDCERTYSGHIDLEFPTVGNERYLNDPNIIHVGRHLVHPIRWRRRNHDILARHTCHPEQQINHLVAADTEEDPVLVRDAAQVGDQLLQGVVRRRRVPVERRELFLGHVEQGIRRIGGGCISVRLDLLRVLFLLAPRHILHISTLVLLLNNIVDRGQARAERILVGVEEDAGVVVVPCGAVGHEGEDVGSDNGLEVEVGGPRGPLFCEAEDRHVGVAGEEGWWTSAADGWCAVYMPVDVGPSSHRQR